MIPAKLLIRSLSAIVNVSYKSEMRNQAKLEAQHLQNVVTTLTGDEFVARRFVVLDKKIQRKMSWNALRDGLNEYRNTVPVSYTHLRAHET